MVVGLISKEMYIQGLSWEAADELISPSAIILIVYNEALTEFSQVYCPDSLNNTLFSQMALAVGRVGKMHIPRKVCRGKVRSLQLPRSTGS